MLVALNWVAMRLKEVKGNQEGMCCTTRKWNIPRYGLSVIFIKITSVVHTEGKCIDKPRARCCCDIKFLRSGLDEVHERIRYAGFDGVPVRNSEKDSALCPKSLRQSTCFSVHIQTVKGTKKK